MPPRFKAYPKDYYQSQLFPANVFDLLPKDHECFLYRELFEQLDTSEVEARYSRRGQRAYAPRQIISILIYAYSRGVFSSRQIEQRCREDLGFMYIAGRNCPNFRVLSDFRKDHGKFFRACFKQTVALAMALGLVSLGHVSLDGSKFKANSSKHKAMSYGRLKEKEQELCEEIEALTAQAERCDEEEDQAYQERTGYELPEDLRDKKRRLKKVREMKQALEAREEELRPGQEIEDKKQISFADPEARIMKDKGDFEYAYNAQISVDGESQVIVGQHVSQAANDSQEVRPALEEMEDATGRLPEKLSLDNGYYSGKNLQEVSDRQVQAYVATDRGEKPGKGDLDESERHLVKADFRYDEQQDGFHCPGGQLLTLKTARRTGHRVYQGDVEVCRSCVYYRRCCRSKSGAARTITSDGKEPLRRAMNERMRQPESQTIYARRKTIVEPVFGQIKNSGFRGFGLRGKEKVAGEFSLVCAAHNLKKIIFAALRGEVCPEFGQRAAWA
ncbi:MAG: IS1182 family transposase [Candidatus Aminicenantes bacterium]|nr:IS1182 family transposase [Candidatus Aminicenantes bacterium]